MRNMKLRKTLSAAILIGTMVVGANALAEPPQGTHGADMMDGYGSGYGMAPGMMDGYGKSPRMLDGQGAGFGVGSGMMGGYGSRANLDLTAVQRGKIAKIQNDLRRKHWDLMGKMHEEQSQMDEQYDSDQRDDAAISKSYRNMSELRQQMFDLSLSARRQIDAVLTAEQRDKIKHG